MEKEIINKVPGNWLAFDFHVHSPCSFDFESEKKNEAGYTWLLEQAKMEGLDIIVFTDHNDIAGYFKLMEIENDLKSTKRTFERNNSPVPESILNQINLLDQVIVLPGVELDIDPNIHLIVIFDPQKIEEISDFLSSAGYIPEVRGNEKTSFNCKWSVSDAFQEAEKINAIVIAAHVDSDKGLYEASRGWGRSRISAFVNESLYGMEFINPVSRDKIENIMTDPLYSRKTKIAFVQSSDFHGHDDQKIGERRTYIRMDEIVRDDKSSIFQALKRALRNPDEFVSAPGRPETQAILKKLSDKPSIQNLENENDIKNLIQYVCAFANSEDGTIVIGRNSTGNLIGFSEKNEHGFEEKITDLIKTKITPAPHFTSQIYPYYGNKYVATIRIRKNIEICSVNEDERVYLLNQGKPQKASTKEVVEIVESRLIERYSYLSITDRLYGMSQKLLGSEDSIDVLPIVRKIDKNSTLLRTVLNSPELGEIIDEDLFLHNIDINGNGCSAGNIIMLSKENPRSEHHYLRVSAPLGYLKCDNEDIELPRMRLFSGEKIIVTAGGAVYYDDHDDIIVGCSMYSPFIFTKKNPGYLGGLKFITAFLKSSVAIWYSERCLGSCDLRKSIILSVPIPNNFQSNTLEIVENLIDKILQKEKEYLSLETALFTKYPSIESQKGTEFKDKLESLLIPHNEEAGKLMGEIDQLFYDFFGLTNKEIEVVEQVIKSKGFAIFPRQLIDN